MLIRERTKIRAPLLERLPKLRADQPAQRLPAHRRRRLHAARRHRLVEPARRHALLRHGRADLGPRARRDAADPAADGVAEGRATGRPASAARCAARRSASSATAASARVVAGYGRAFGMHVLVWAREDVARARAGRRPRRRRRARRRSSSDATCSRCTCGSSMRRAASSTAADLARMKPTALLVNTSRAPLIEPGALVDALRAGRPGMAAVDVYEEEPCATPRIRCSTMHERHLHAAHRLCDARRIRTAVHRHLRPDHRLRRHADQRGQPGRASLAPRARALIFLGLHELFIRATTAGGVLPASRRASGFGATHRARIPPWSSRSGQEVLCASCRVEKPRATWRAVRPAMSGGER